uniref:Uncharacterized protein n=1 Tax=Oryza sativa subsp. japonica TaxID=39947 RepID=Q6Z0B0_ORYSJ|nr:hypothetical protein [Oryza sativa Japonica Group]BAD05674.1 hypothetical protein [Oryza sativa Japonica Group]
MLTRYQPDPLSILILSTEPGSAAHFSPSAQRVYSSSCATSVCYSKLEILGAPTANLFMARHNSNGCQIQIQGLTCSMVL